jgi:iron(III) transport system permease protein
MITIWRAAACVALGLIVGLPLARALGWILDADAWQLQVDDLYRIVRLSGNTLLLVGGTCLLTIPSGTFLAVLLFRTALPGRRILVGLLVLLLFVPLPVIVSSWQGFLGARGLLPIALWTGSEDRVWATGFVPAIWVHAIAALPWATCIVGLGLQWVEPELEEEAALQLPPWRVVWEVTVPRCRASILAAMLFVALQTAGEISVTDMMLVYSLAEEVYTEFTLGQPLGRTLLLAVPELLAVVALVAWVAVRLERELPPLPLLLREPRVLLQRPGWACQVATVLTLAALVVPAIGLVWRLGAGGEPQTWSPAFAWYQLTAEARLNGVALVRSLATALASGMAVAGLAVIACWLARDSMPMRVVLLVLLGAAWVLPAPVIGVGLKELILAMVPAPRDLQQLPDGIERGVLQFWSDLLYSGPSPLPIIWAHVIRFLPAAVLFLWPVMRLIPSSLFEAARLEGAGPLRELVFVVWPMTRRAASIIALAATALAVGEIAAAGRVETPSWDSFTRLLFDRMHYGVAANVAALSVLLLIGVSLAVGLVFAIKRMWSAAV